MKTILFIVLFALAGFANADEPASLIRAINAVDNAREALVADLALNLEGRDEFASCPSELQFDSVAVRTTLSGSTVKRLSDTP